MRLGQFFREKAEVVLYSVANHILLDRKERTLCALNEALDRAYYEGKIKTMEGDFVKPGGENPDAMLEAFIEDIRYRRRKLIRGYSCFAGNLPDSLVELRDREKELARPCNAL